MQLAIGDNIASLAEPDDFRMALQVLSQRTRFQIFRLICTYPGQLSLDDLCSELRGSREKLYHHLYQMLRVSLIVAQVDLIGRKCFSPNQKFLVLASGYFSKYQVGLCNQSKSVSKAKLSLNPDIVGSKLAD